MSEKKLLPPTIRKGEGGNEYETHPSYGIVNVSRYTCMPAQHFFGSAIAQNSGVSISIHTAERQRSLSEDWYHDTGEIIEVNMTEAQWAQLLSHFNVGPGVPCTLNHVNRNIANNYTEMSVPRCPEVHERKKIETEFKERMQDISKGVEELVKLAEALQEKPNVNKADRKQFRDIAETLRCQIANNMPFIAGQFNEALDGMVTNAKADVESFMGQLLRQAGVEAIKDRLTAASAEIVKQIEDSRKPVEVTDAVVVAKP